MQFWEQKQAERRDNDGYLKRSHFLVTCVQKPGALREGGLVDLDLIYTMFKKLSTLAELTYPPQTRLPQKVFCKPSPNQ